MRYYSVVLDPEPDAGYTAWAPALPDCRGRGESVNEALAAVCLEIEARLRELARSGRLAPEDVAPLVVSVEVTAPSDARPSGGLPAPAPAACRSA